MKCKIPFLKHQKISYEKYCKHYAYGNIIDLMGSLIVMMFCFALIFAMMCYGKLTEMKLSIDEVCKTYLYQMEPGRMSYRRKSGRYD